jgi:hypothetical protein
MKKFESKNKHFFALICILILIFFVILYKNLQKNIECNKNNLVDNEMNIDKWIEKFRLDGKETDKTFVHEYQNLYGRFLGPLINKNINLLEIGLGCAMPYGPGKSISLWEKYLQNAIINILEYDRECSLPFKNKVNKIYIGDQRDFTLLKEIADDSSFDVIIDDGGHSRKGQINSLIGLWPSLKPKGLYIIEDIFTSLHNRTNDNPNESAIDIINHLNILINKTPLGEDLPIIPDNISKHTYEIAKDLLFTSCFKKVCILGKK